MISACETISTAFGELKDIELNRNVLSDKLKLYIEANCHNRYRDFISNAFIRQNSLKDLKSLKPNLLVSYFLKIKNNKCVSHLQYQQANTLNEHIDNKLLEEILNLINPLYEWVYEMKKIYYNKIKDSTIKQYSKIAEK